MSTRKSSKSLRRSALERDDFTCQKCGLREPDIMHVDHIVPRAIVQDGYDTLDNLVTLCPNDHARKTLEDRTKYPFKVWNKGKKYTLDEKSKLDTSWLNLGRQWAKGRAFSQEHRRRLSDAHKGQTSFWKGKKLSEEHRRKLSESHKGKIPWNKSVIESYI